MASQDLSSGFTGSLLTSDFSSNESKRSLMIKEADRGRNAVLPKMQNGQYWPFHKTSDPERGRTSDLQNEVGRQRVASGALSLDSKLYQMHVSISPFPNRTGEFPRIRLSKGPAFALGRLNDRKRTMNKNNRHRTTLRVVVCAACLSALLPSRGVHWTCY